MDIFQGRDPFRAAVVDRLVPSLSGDYSSSHGYIRVVFNPRQGVGIMAEKQMERELDCNDRCRSLAECIRVLNDPAECEAEHNRCVNACRWVV